jgi:alpha/beta superfamily hydrolase
MVHGDKDELVPHESVAKLVQKLSNQRDIQIDYKLIKGATHFFQDHLDQVAERVDDYLEALYPSAKTKAKPRVAATR